VPDNFANMPTPGHRVNGSDIAVGNDSDKQLGELFKEN
jgi:hypothetical protein